jgi:hypothetical protein
VKLDGSDPMLLYGFGSYEVQYGIFLKQKEKFPLDYAVEPSIIYANIVGSSWMYMTHLETKPVI